MERIGEHFSILDYAISICLLLISLIIGIVSAFKGNKSPEEFLLGNRSLNIFTVAMSLLSSFVSALHLIGFTTEVYLHGTQLFLMSVGCVIGITFSLVFVLPVIHPLKLISIHEYVELRFRSPNLELLLASFVVINMNIHIGVCLNATALALATFTPFSFVTCTLAIGIVCTVYSSVGGVRAVVWTDAFQLVVMFIGLAVFVIAGTFQSGGIENIYSIAEEGKRIQFLNTNPNPSERHNIYNTIAFGAFYYGALGSASQIIMQRTCSVKTLTEAKRVLLFSMIGFVFLYIIIFFGGVVVYSSYAGCDPLLEGKIEKYNQILPFYVMDKLGHIIGLRGIYAATFISSTLSTYSSYVNAEVAIIWKIFLIKFDVFSRSNSSKSALINKILTLVFGAIFIGMAFLTKKASNIIQLSLTASGVLNGVLFGVIILGVCVPFSNKKGVWTGAIITYAFVLWIYIGSLKYGKSPNNLPLSTNACPRNLTSNITYDDGLTFFNRTTDIFLKENSSNISEEYNSVLFINLYRISYTLYMIIGPVLVVIIGTVVSYVTGDKNGQEIPQELVFQWSKILHLRKKKENCSFQLEENNEI